MATDWKAGVRIPAGQHISLFHKIQTDSGVAPFWEGEFLEGNAATA
jgi:hypothetical protein